MPDHEVFELGEVALKSGATLPDARLAYRTYGSLNAARDNVIVLPTFYTGTHLRNEGYLRAVPALDPSRHFIVSVNLFGNGLSSSPSNTAPPFDGPRFPAVTLHDNVACQHRLLTERLGVKRIALKVPPTSARARRPALRRRPAVPPTSARARMPALPAGPRSRSARGPI